MKQHPHLVFLTFGSAGDMYPFIALARAMQSQGRQVTFIATAYHAPMLEKTGLHFIPVGTKEEFLRILGKPDVWDPRKGFSALLEGTHKHLLDVCDALLALSPDTELTVLSHMITVPAVTMAREKGRRLKLVGGVLAPSNLRTHLDPLRMGPVHIPRWVPQSWRRAMWRHVDATVVDPVAAREVNTARQARGLGPISNYLGHIADAPDAWLTLFPAWFAPPHADWPTPIHYGDFMRYDPFADDALPPEVAEFLAAGDAPLIFTPGTAHAHADTYFKTAHAAVQRTGRRAIFLTRFRKQVPASLPPSILWTPYVPLARLLPHAAALIHHGGIGTTSAALHAGTPQLVTPFAWDQFDNAARIAALGVGAALHATKMTPRRLARALDALLKQPALSAICRQTAAKSQENAGPERVFAQVEALLAAAP